MNNDNLLELVPYDNDEHLNYMLKNQTMKPSLFNEKILQLEKVCKDHYGVSYNQVLKTDNINGEDVLLVGERFVGGVVKAFVLTPSMNVSVAVTKRNNETRTFTAKDFSQNIQKTPNKR